jgi:hypothetical protein
MTEWDGWKTLPEGESIHVTIKFHVPKSWMKQEGLFDRIRLTAAEEAEKALTTILQSSD